VWAQKKGPMQKKTARRARRKVTGESLRRNAREGAKARKKLTLIRTQKARAEPGRHGPREKEGKIKQKGNWDVRAFGASPHRKKEDRRTKKAQI